MTLAINSKILDLLWEIGKYVPWAFIQQVFVVSLFLFLFQFQPLVWAIAGAVSIFSFLHFPNRFLMILVFFVEAILLYFYRDIFSLLWMTVLHSTIAVLLNTYLPESITHGMRVLWNYYKN